MRGYYSIGRWLAIGMLTALFAAAPSHASTEQEMIIQEDPLLLSAQDQAEVDAVFMAFKAVGIDRVRVSLFWDHVAPERLSQSKPDFPEPGPSDPAAYPAGTWTRYDRIMLASRRIGVDVLMTLTGPGPAWATPGTRCKKAGPFVGCEEGVYKPDAREFQDFATAAGTRYSGSYQLEPDAPAGHGESPIVLPRVDHWSIWNEPNFPAWLLPMWRANSPRTPKQMVAVAPHHYRGLVDAAYAGLDATGHGDDTVLIGETAPRGEKNPKQLGKAMPPAEFVRELYCLTAAYRPYTGRAARLRGCPVTAAERDEFVDEHSGLFRSQGWAQHAYSVFKKRWRTPTWRHELRDNVPIGNIDHLIRTLDRVTGVWDSLEFRKGIWITEYGYQTTPPDPTAGVDLERQGPLSSWGEFVAYNNPRVASIAQFLLFDDKPLAELAEDDPRRWVTWQSGLYTADGEAKPYLDDFRWPLHVARRGAGMRVFATSRPAPTGSPLTARIEFAPPGGPWTRLRTVRVTNPRGYLDASVRPPGRGQIRVVWEQPGSEGSVASRSANAR